MLMYKRNFYPLLSVDIWDTVLRRKCHPDEVKVRLSSYLISKYGSYIQPAYNSLDALTIARFAAEGYLAKAAEAQGVDDEYKLKEVYSYWLKTVFEEEKAQENLEFIINDLETFEISAEIDVLYLDSGIVSKINQYQYENIVFISDFYMPKNIVEIFLAKAGWEIQFDKGYVSCDFLLNKRSGNLFKKVHIDFGISPEQHIHIGDNIISDVKIPKALGINTWHYKNKLEDTKRQSNQQKFNVRFQDLKGYYQHIETLIQREIKANTDLNKKQSELLNIGKKYSVLFYSFVLYVIEQAIADSHSVVYYFTREGEFFKKIHDIIKANNPLTVEIPQAELLEVSRIATFSPSLKEVSLPEFMRIWNMYSSQSIKALFISLNIELQDYDKFWHIYGIDVNEKIQYPWLDEKIISLFNDADFISQLTEDIRSKRNIVMQYLLSKDIRDNQDKLAIVDIGWRGTIQDNLASILNETEITGYYFALQPFLNQQPANSKKKSYGPNANLNEDYLHCIKFVSPYEMICNSPNGSVKGYEYDEHNPSVVKAIRKTDPIENLVYEEYTQYIQQGVLSCIDLICQQVKIHSFSSSDLKEYAYKLLENLSINPERILAESYFGLNHDETFGLGLFLNKKAGKIFPKKLFLRAVFFKKHRREFWDYVEDSGWPQGFLKYYYMNYLKNRYNHLSKYMDK